MAKRRQKSKSARKKGGGEQHATPAIPTKRSSPVGWIVLLAPLSIVLFVLLFGDKIPFLTKQSAVESEDAARVVCDGADVDIKAGNYQAAYSKLRYALTIKPDYPDAHIKLGRLFYLNKNFPEAIDWMRRAVALDPPQKDLVLNNLGLLYAQQGDFETALSMFEQALATGLNAEQIYNNIGNVNLSLKNYDKAIAAFQAAVDHRPSVRSLYTEMLRKVLIDFRSEEDLAGVVQAASDHLDRGITNAELALYDAESIRRFGRTRERERELNRNLAMARALKAETSQQ
jgi:tetratricopeptide (TPR) repeat protein